MKQIKKIPSINIPIQKPDGSLEWVWYMFLQWLSENSEQVITTGEENGTIAVNGTDVPVKGLGSAAYQSDDDYVHKAGTETVPGYKYFSGGLSRKMTSYAYTETPTDIVYNGIYATDKNNESWACCNFAKGTSGQNVAGLLVKGANGDWCDTGLGISVSLNGDTSTFAPTPPASDSTTSTQIATCGWVNDYTLSTRIVHKDGNENIAGAKEFITPWGTKANRVIYSRGSETYTESTSAWTLEGGIHIIGPNDTESYGAFETIKDGDVTYSQINARGKDGNWASTPLGIGKGASGETYTFAPTPNTLSNDTNIATTAYVVNVLKTIYPVGSIYIGTTASCPLAALFGTWELIQGRYLLSSGTLAGTSETYAATNTVASGLPQISGATGVADGWSNGNDFGSSSGAFAPVWAIYGRAPSNGEGSRYRGADFYASRSSAVFNQSLAVRAPAYVVNVWRRTA